MKRFTATVLILIAITIIATGVYVSVKSKDAKDIFESIAIVAGLLFFLYKILTGWLFINLNVKVETERERYNEDSDHVVFKIVLSKGDVDSVWLENIEIRLTDEIDNKSGIPNHNESRIINPVGIKKMLGSIDETSGVMDYWKGKEENYVISLNEEAIFSAFTTIKKDKVILAEVLVLGTRPFYSIGNKLFKRPELVQWKSSLYVLPCKTKAS